VSDKPIVLREAARRDIDAALDHYSAQAGEVVALGFVDELEHAFRDIGRHPAAGSPRYGHELELPGLRTWPVRRFPYLIFYVERAEDVDVWRVLHARRDIPAWLQAPGA
jgi:toxin ParE1/3/4